MKNDTPVVRSYVSTSSDVQFTLVPGLQCPYVCTQHDEVESLQCLFRTLAVYHNDAAFLAVQFRGCNDGINGIEICRLRPFRRHVAQQGKSKVVRADEDEICTSPLLTWQH